MDPIYMGDGLRRASRLGAIIKSPITASRWLLKRLTSTRNDDALPTLPAQRPRPVTPTQSCNNNLTPDPGPAVAQSAFFQRLPPEIRRRILIEAFGEQTVHMDLIYGHPPRSPKSRRSPRGDVSHCNLSLYRHGGMDESRVKVRDLQPKRWMWRSSVCHRNIPVPGSYAPYAEPSQDLCRFGIVGEHICDFWPGEYPTKCCIGATGWILACRQAYLEGIDVLYSTNTIHSASKELLYGIDKFLLPQRLSSVNSVELMWEFDVLRMRDRTSHSPAFAEFLDAVPSMFPRVASLYITIQWRMPWPPYGSVPDPSEEEFEAGESIVMKPVDAMVGRLGPHVRDCQVAIPSTMYGPRRRRAKAVGGVVEQLCYGDRLERYWRPLGKPASAHRPGYWVRLGQKDIAFPYRCPLHRDAVAVAVEDWSLFWGA